MWEFWKNRGSTRIPLPFVLLFLTWETSQTVKSGKHYHTGGPRFGKNSHICLADVPYLLLRKREKSWWTGRKVPKRRTLVLQTVNGRSWYKRGGQFWQFAQPKQKDPLKQAPLTTHSSQQNQSQLELQCSWSQGRRRGEAHPSPLSTLSSHPCVGKLIIGFSSNLTNPDRQG